MHKSRKSPSRALLRREGHSLLFFMASRVKLSHGLLAPLRPTTTYVHGSVSLPRFHSPLCSKEHVELISSVNNNDGHFSSLLVVERGTRTGRACSRVQALALLSVRECHVQAGREHELVLFFPRGRVGDVGVAKIVLPS